MYPTGFDLNGLLVSNGIMPSSAYNPYKSANTNNPFLRQTSVSIFNENNNHYNRGLNFGVNSNNRNNPYNQPATMGQIVDLMQMMFNQFVTGSIAFVQDQQTKTNPTVNTPDVYDLPPESNTSGTETDDDVPADDVPTDDVPADDVNDDAQVEEPEEEPDTTLKFQEIIDTKDNNMYEVSGKNNEVVFSEDYGENVFKLGGENNKIKVNNIGADDSVILEGKKEDWEIVNKEEENNNQEGHILILKNKNTGTTVEVASDEKNRDTDWIKGRITYNTA